ncbi:putative hexokinase [Triangularia setosa]|uniref:Phosphotransferase n=1 Tax=Triangularia setosa TaxID=2587417 RepID=A0AAN6W0Q8_9PEZI|nr:putative hexokinase [Podospora setosa]
MDSTLEIDKFLEPLAIDAQILSGLSCEMASTFAKLSAESTDMFLPTPISDSILAPEVSAGKGGSDGGRGEGNALFLGECNKQVGSGRELHKTWKDPGLTFLSGGTNLRVGFIELQHKLVIGDFGVPSVSRKLNRLLEHSWPIVDSLKNENSTSLFSWIGNRIAHVVRKGCDAFSLSPDQELPLGVTFSFPMQQTSLSEAKLMAMGKGFAITSDLDLGGHLTTGYEKHKSADMPGIKIAAIANDSVSTLVSFIYQFPAKTHQKAVMGVIVGTGCNATIPLKLSSLHESKRPASINVLPGQDVAAAKIAVNTEWSINGSAPPLRKFGLINKWDEELDKAGEIPGFQPLEYMTAGRYLGELGRIMFLDYYATVLKQSTEKLPGKFRQKFGLTTTFLSHYHHNSPNGSMADQLNNEFPAEHPEFEWTKSLETVLFKIAVAIQKRAAGIIAASTVGLLMCAEEIPKPGTVGKKGVTELVVGYTGGCIQHFQDYLADTQAYLDKILSLEFGGEAPIRVVLHPCHDGGITGAGVLVPAALASRRT